MPTHAQGKPLDESPAAERRRLEAAIKRMLSGRPRIAAAGDLSVSALAVEAEVPRIRLYRVHVDLREDFVARAREVAATDEATDAPEVQALKAEVERLRDSRRQARALAEQWKTTAETMARAAQAERIRADRLERQVNLLRGRAERSSKTPTVRALHPAEVITLDDE